MDGEDDTPPSLDLWWAVPGVLAGMSMPFIDPERRETPGASLDAYPDELPLLWRAGIRAIVCMLNMPSAEAVYSAAGFAFHLMPVLDGDAPTHEQFAQFLGFLSEQRTMNRAVAVHCEAGIGRTGTALAGYLITSGCTLASAVARVRSVRPGAVETTRQMRFLHQVQAAIEGEA